MSAQDAGCHVPVHAGRPARAFAHPPFPPRLCSFPALAVAAVPFAIAIAVCVSLSIRDRLHVTGDEPHYLIMADGLVRDHTFDLRSAYAREARTEAIYGSPIPAPHIVIVNHRWGPYHEPGLALLLAIPFLVGRTLASRVALCVVGAWLLPLLCFKWLRVRMPAQAAAWLTIGLCVGVPVSFGASQIYPDLPAGIAATALLLWLLERTRDDPSAARWASFWLAAGLLPWLNLKFLAATAALIFAAAVVMGSRERRAERRMALATSALVLIGPAALAAFHVWAFGTPFGPRGAKELTTSVSRAAMILLGLHFDQGQGMFWQQPLLLAGVAAWMPFARRHPRVALGWIALYASLILPNALELARYGGGAPAGRFGWSAAWLWIVPIGYLFDDGGDMRRSRFVKPAAAVSLGYQAVLAVRWLGDPGVLFPALEESLVRRNSLFPIGLRAWLPSFYFWDFRSYWTYGPDVAAYVGFACILLSGALFCRASVRDTDRRDS
jgi:hypothetical protein